MSHNFDKKFQELNLWPKKRNIHQYLFLAKFATHYKKFIDINDAGTSFRFLTAFLCLQQDKEFILTGSERLKERPIKDLVNVLQKMGAEIEYLDKEGFAPLRILGGELEGGYIQVDGGISSQFISAILLIAPTLYNGIKLKITWNLNYII